MSLRRAMVEWAPRLMTPAPDSELAEAWTMRLRGASTALLLLPPFLLAWLGWRQRWVSEDAFILLRVVQNLLSGQGPVWNIHERVEAYTSPLWVGVLTAVTAALGSARLEWI